MKRFYGALLAIAVVGTAILVYAANRSGAPRPSPALGPADSAVVDSFPGYVSGSAAAPVEVVEYADFQCPGCARFALLQLPTIREQLIATGKVRWRYRDFPLSSLHEWARLAAHAAACADEQGRFERMHDLLYERQREWAVPGENPERVFRTLARDAGLDVGRWRDCMASNRYAGRIEASFQEATRLGLPGTPSFLVNGQYIDFDRPGWSPNSDRFQAIADSLTRPSARAGRPRR